MNSQFYATVGAFFAISIYCLGTILAQAQSKSENTGFFDPGKSALAVSVSLACFNITLGTSIAYLSDQVSKVGMLALFSPIAFLVGYLILSIFWKRLNFTIEHNRPNILSYINKDPSYKSQFHITYNLLVVATFIALVALEIWLGSEYISRTIFYDPPLAVRLVVAGSITAIVLSYTSISGTKGAVISDFIQGFILLGFLWSVFQISKLVTNHDVHTVKMVGISTVQIMTVFLAVVTAISTQFYSTVNNTLPVSFKPKTQRSIIFWQALAVMIYYVIIIFIFNSSNQTITLGMLTDKISEKNSTVRPIDAIVFSAGLFAITMSTIDNGILATYQIYYQNIRKINESEVSRDGYNPSAKEIRAAYFISTSIALAMALVFIVVKLDVFYLVLTLLYALTVLVPITTAIILIHKENGTSIFDVARNSILCFVLICVGWLIYLILTLNKEVKLAMIFHILCFFGAIIIGLKDYIKARKIV